MRRFIAISLVVILFWTIPLNVSVFATSNTYEIDEMELELSIPSGYSVITRDTPANDPIFSDLGTNKSALISQFESSNIYLSAISDTYNEEVVVTMMENSLSNFSLLSDTTLNTLVLTWVDQYTDYGINVSKYEIYQHSQAKFVKLYFTDTGKTVHGLQYYTVYDGKAMNFTMRSYEGSLSSRQETEIKTIVDSIKYDKAPPIADQGEDTNSFPYTDTDSGVTFTVPANWKQEEFTKDREFIDVKFVSTKEDGCAIIYGSKDMWSQMSASDKVGYTRSDINNSIFTKSDIAEIFSTTADNISTVTYNGVEYFKCEANYTSDTYDFDITVTMTRLAYINNGWMYMFLFSGTSTHELYSEFESLLKSVQYSTVSNVGGVVSTYNTTINKDDNSDDNYGIIAATVLLFVVAVIVVAIVISRKKNNRPVNYAPINNTPTADSPNNPEASIYCTKCGQSLPFDSDFCHKCGTKIEKEN